MKFLSLPSAFEAILCRLAADSRSIFDRDVDLIPVEYHERPYSHLVRLKVQDRKSRAITSHAFVKLFKDKPVPGEPGGMAGRVQRDYELTRRIHQGMSRWPDLAAVRPLACYPEQLAIVTEEAAGRPLLQYVQDRAAWFPGAAQLQQLRVAGQRAGRWLRAFQTLNIDESAPTAIYSSEALREYVDVRLKRLIASGHWITEDLRRDLLAHFDAAAAEVVPGRLQEVPIHADYSLGNILVRDDRIVVLDFAMAKRGSVYHDLTRLVVQLDALTAKPQFRRSTIATLRTAVLVGFGGNVSEDDPLFRLLVLMHRVNHYATLCDARAPIHVRLFNRRVKQTHRRWIEAELRHAPGSGASS